MTSGENLYKLLDNEENGITIMQEMSDNETGIITWNCVIDAVAYTSKKAFESEGVKYYPEPIALADDTLVDHFISCFKKCADQSDQYILRIYALLDKYKNGDISSDRRAKVVREGIKDSQRPVKFI